MSDRRRNIFILLVVLGLLAASAAVLLTKSTRLGLDLKGGVELVYQGKPTPQQKTVDAEAITRAIEVMRKRVDSLGVSEPEIQRSGNNQISVALPDVKNAQRAIDQVGQVAQLFFYDWEKNVIGPDGKTDPSNNKVVDTGLSHFDAVERASKQPAHLDGNNTTGKQYYLFSKNKKLLAGPEDTKAALTEELPGRKVPVGSKTFEVKEGTIVVRGDKPDSYKSKLPYDKWFVLLDNPELKGTDIRRPKQSFQSGPGSDGSPNVVFEFTKKGGKEFHDITRRLAQRGRTQAVGGGKEQTFAAILDGNVESRASIDYRQYPDGIDGGTGAQIDGKFTIQQAQDLAKTLEIGALPIKLELISQSQVSAKLGKQALHQGLIAGLVGLGLVALFLIIFYRVLGLVAVAALVVYAIYFYALIKLIPITLTLPGIAGLILTVGVAADANIVIFERIKEEIRSGRSVVSGIRVGYKKGFATIVDANVVTLMTAFILFVLATAGVKGFAFTLGIGTIVSLFTAVLATQAILGTFSGTRLISSRSALGASKQDKARWRLDFMGAAKWFFSLSGLILLVGALAIGGKGINFGIDFKSGTRIKTALEKPANEQQVRSVMSAIGYSDATIQRVKDPELGKNVFQIATPQLGPNKVQEVRTKLDQRFGVGNNFSNESIGPTFGKTVAHGAIIAIIISLFLIALYIAIRFEWKFAVPVLIALMHDILITGGVYALVGREVTTATVAALLTILGFSLYDTIIVFDRIRENVPRMPRAAFSQIVNRSMSEVLTRSLATSFCTLLPVLSLLLFGGDTLKDFAFALLVGIASGTYSSIFIASPVLVHWKERERLYSRRRKRIAEDNNGVVPAFAPQDQVALDNSDEEQKKGRRKSLAELSDTENVSLEDFSQMVQEVRESATEYGIEVDEVQLPQEETRAEEEAQQDGKSRRSGSKKPMSKRKAQSRRRKKGGR